MTELETLREQLRRQQKLASLGMLSAGIAHEIQNPLNFVINFSKMSERILADMRDILDDIEEAMDNAPQDAAERLGDTAENIAELHDIADDLTGIAIALLSAPPVCNSLIRKAVKEGRP